MKELEPHIKSDFKKPEIENIEREKKEYFLLGTYLKTPGLKIFYYNSQKNEVHELYIKKCKTLIIKPIDGELIAMDYEASKVQVDSRWTFFEALNMRTANKRLQKFKQGKIKELFNLKTPSKEGIKFY